jgi:DeoR/GlpR family transcriptional regulator of sugar metabolism
MEHQKFDSNECYKYAKLDDIDAVITDEEPNPEIRELIESVGVDII